MAFPSGFLDELRSRLQLSTVVGRHVRLTRAGREFKAPCPFHSEKTPSFYVNDQKGFYHCFGCGAHGDAIGFVMRQSNASFLEAVEQLAAEAGLAVPKPTVEDKQRFEKQKSLYDLLDQVTLWFESQLRAPVGREALKYLQVRGLDDDSIARFRLGYAPADGAALRQALLKKGFAPAEMVEAGVCKSPDDGRDAYSFFRHRVMFPVADRRGRVVAFGGRLIEGEGPKYINSPDTPLFHKGSLLYGLSRARQAVADGQPVVVAEGYMDVIALVRAGFAGAVAPLGTALTETQLAEVWKLYPDAPREPILCFDGDNAGRRAAFRAVERALPLLKPAQSVRIAFMPQGEDPDSLIRTQGASAMRNVLDTAVSLVDVLWDMETAGRSARTPEDKAGIRQALENRLGQIADPSVQAYYRQDVRQRLYTAFGGKSFQSGKVKTAPVIRRSLPLNAQEQRQRLLLACLMAHPALFAEVGESLARAEFSAGVWEDLRAALVVVLEADPALDSAGVTNQLKGMNMAAVDSVQQMWAGRQVRFATPAASIEEAREGWRHTWELFQQGQLQKDLRQAQENLAQNPSPEALSRLILVQQEIQNSRNALDGEEDVV